MTDSPLSVLERTDTAPTVAPTDDGDHDRFSHYVKKADLGAYYMSEIIPTALCGKKWAPGHDPKRYPICPTCKEIYEGIPAGDDAP